MTGQTTKKTSTDFDTTTEGRIVRLESSQKTLFNALEQLTESFNDFAQEVRRSIGGLQKGPNPQTMASWAAVLLVVIGGIMWPVIREQNRLNDEIRISKERDLDQAYQDGKRDGVLMMMPHGIDIAKK